MNHLTAPVAFLTYNTLVVAVGVAAVGCAAGVVGTFGVLRKRALVGDAAAHASKNYIQRMPLSVLMTKHLSSLTKI